MLEGGISRWRSNWSSSISNCVFYGPKQVVILQQIWATLIISQVLQALRLEIANKAGVDPFDVSIGLLVQYAPQYGYEGRDPVKVRGARA